MRHFFGAVQATGNTVIAGSNSTRQTNGKAPSPGQLGPSTQQEARAKLARASVIYHLSMMRQEQGAKGKQESSEQQRAAASSSRGAAKAKSRKLCLKAQCSTTHYDTQQAQAHPIKHQWYNQWRSE
jgi:hypothetical protein